MKVPFRSAAIAASALTLAVGAAACGSSSDDSGSGTGTTSGKATAPDNTIKVGQIVTEGGVVSFPATAAPAVKAVFDEVNANGGIDGNKIEVTSINDNVNPTNTTAATRKLIGDDVVAFVGSDSPYDCAVNNPLYAQAKVYAVGLGIAGACFSNPTWASVGNSPATTNAAVLKWASEKYGPKVCMLGTNYPGFAAQYEGANKLLTGEGIKLTYQNTTLPQTGNSTSSVLAAARAGCDAVTLNYTATQTVQALQAAKRQNLKMQLIGASGLYRDEVIKALGPTGEGFVLGAQMEPWHERTPANAEYVDLMKKNNVGLDEFSTAGYISAKAFVEALKTIKGPIDRESVGKALAALKYDTTMLAQPFSFNHPAGPDGGNAPNVSTKMIEIKDGKFETISDFITVPSNLLTDAVNF